MKIYQLQLSESGLQYVVGLLMKQSIGDAGPLFDDVRAQVTAQEQADVAAQRKAIEDEVRAELAKPKKPAST